MANNNEETQSYPELHDIPRVSIQEAKRQILLSIKYGQRRGCIVLVGDAGLGKTQSIYQLGKELNKKVIPIHTAHFGLMGSGVPTKVENGQFRIALPNIFPKEGEEGILLFDEWNRGPKHALDMFFTMLEDGRQFDYVLPEGFIVVGTMNPSTAAYHVTQIENEAAMRRRIKFFYVIPSFKEWLDYAKTEEFHAFSRCAPAKGKACHRSILGYFKGKPNAYYDYKARDAGKQFCTPAGIETISEDAYNAEAEGISFDDDYVLHRIGSSVGMSLATELVAYMANNAVILNASDILYSWKTAKKQVKKLLEVDNREVLSEVAGNTLKLLFAEVPDVETVAGPLSEFYEMIPPDLATGVLQNMKTEADAVNQTQYLFSLMRKLQEHPAWVTLFTRIITNEKESEKELTETD